MHACIRFPRESTWTIKYVSPTFIYCSYFSSTSRIRQVVQWTALRASPRAMRRLLRRFMAAAVASLLTSVSYPSTDWRPRRCDCVATAPRLQWRVRRDVWLQRRPSRLRPPADGATTLVVCYYPLDDILSCPSAHLARHVTQDLVPWADGPGSGSS
jgi:hypothetical protein